MILMHHKANRLSYNDGSFWVTTIAEYTGQMKSVKLTYKERFAADGTLLVQKLLAPDGRVMASSELK